MKKILSCFFALSVIILFGSGAILAKGPPGPDHDIHLGESVCVPVWPADCGNPAVGIITDYPSKAYPPVLTITPGCDPIDTPCDSPDCEDGHLPCGTWPADIDTQLFWVGFLPCDCENNDTVECTGAAWSLVVCDFTCFFERFCVCITFDYVLPVELMAFTAVAGDGEVRLNWTTATESDNDHWDIDRATSPDGPWIKIHEEPGQGTVSTETHYAYVDQNVQNGVTYWYRLTDVTLTGVRESHSLVSATPGSLSDEVPREFVLKQNFPNPFNPSTTFEFAIPQEGFTTLKIHDLLGREVATVLKGNLEARHYRVTWDAGNLPSGVYLYTLTTSDFLQTRKLVLMK